MGYNEKTLNHVVKNGALTQVEFETFKLLPIKQYSAAQIKRIRKNNKVSQAVFAAYLNTSPSTVLQWEQNQKHSKDTALKLLSLVDKQGLKALA
jgi:putative transcriptional regulator